MIPQRLKLSIQCRGLSNSHLLHKPSPICTIYLLDGKTGSLQQEIGRSEVVSQTTNPDFLKAFQIEYMYGQEDQTHLMIKFRDRDPVSGTELGSCLVTLANILRAENRVAEFRLKNPEKGKARILAELIEADLVTIAFISLVVQLNAWGQGDKIKLEIAGKDLKIKDRIWRGAGCAVVKIFRRRPHEFDDEIILEVQAVGDKQSDNRNPSFDFVEADLGHFSLGSKDCILRLEVWENLSGGQHFLGQVSKRLDDILKATLPDLLVISKDSDKGNISKFRGNLAILRVEIILSNHTLNSVLGVLNGVCEKMDESELGAEHAAFFAQLTIDHGLKKLQIPSNSTLEERITLRIDKMISECVAKVEHRISQVFVQKEGGDIDAMFDVASAERVLDFFQGCSAHSFSWDWQSTEQNFLKYLDKISESSLLKTDARFVELKEGSFEDGASRKQCAREIHMKMCELRNWKRNFPRIFTSLKLQEIIDDWAERFAAFHAQIAAKVSGLCQRRLPDARNFLDALEGLEELDSELKFRNGFRSLVTDSRQALRLHELDSFKEISRLVSEHKWPALVGENFVDILEDESIESRDARKIIGDEVQRVVEELEENFSEFSELHNDIRSDSENIKILLTQLPQLKLIETTVAKFCEDTICVSLSDTIAAVVVWIEVRLTQNLDALECNLTADIIDDDDLATANMDLCCIRDVYCALKEFNLSEISVRVEKLEKLLDFESRQQAAFRASLERLDQLRLKARSCTNVDSELARIFLEMCRLGVSELEGEAACPSQQTANFAKSLNTVLESELENVKGRVLAFEQSEQGNDENGPKPIDAMQAESMFKFFHDCQHEAVLARQVQPFEKVFLVNIGKCIQRVWTHLEEVFAKVRNCDFILDSNNRRQMARQILVSLEEAQEWRDKYPRLYKCLGGKPNFVAEWLGRLEECRLELEMEVTRLKYQGRQDAVVKRLEVAHALSVLDRYLDEGRRFQKLFSEGMSEVCARNESRLEAARDVIRQHKWTTHGAELLVELFMDEFLETEVKKLKADLSKSVQIVLDSALEIVHSPPLVVADSNSIIEFVQAVIHLIPNLQTIRQHFLALCPETVQLSFQDGFTLILSILQDKVSEYLDSLEDLIAETQASIEFLKRSKLNVNTLAHISEAMKKYWDRVSVPAKIKKIENMIDSELQFQECSKRIIQEFQSFQSKARKSELSPELVKTFAQMQSRIVLAGIECKLPIWRSGVEISAQLDLVLVAEIERVGQRVMSAFGTSVNKSQDGLGTLDADAVYKSFIFFDACSMEESVVVVIEPIEKSFVDKLTQHCMSIRKQMESRFGTVKSDSVESSLRRQLARELSTQLEEAQEWRDKYPRLYKCLGGKPNFVAEWLGRLEECRLELEMEVTRLKYQGRQDAVVKRLEVAHALSVLDRYLDEGRRFQKLFSEGMSEVCARNESRLEAARDVIRQHKWTTHGAELLAELLADMDLEMEATKLRAELEIEVKTLLERASKTAEGSSHLVLDGSTAVQQIEPTVKAVAEVLAARNLVFKVCPNDIQKALEDCVDGIRQSTCQKMIKFVDCLDRLLKSDEKSLEVLRRIEYNLRIILAVREMVDSNIADFISHSFADKLESVEAEFQAQLSSCISFYAHLQVTEYPKFPPKDMFRFLGALSTPGVFHCVPLVEDLGVVRSRLEIAIRSSVREFTQKAALEGDIDCQELKEVQTALPYLPESLGAELVAEVGACKEQIQRTALSNDAAFDEALRCRNISVIQKMLDKGGSAHSSHLTKLCAELHRLTARAVETLDARLLFSTCEEARDLATIWSGLRRVREVADAADAVRLHATQVWNFSLRILCMSLRSISAVEAGRHYAFMVDMLRLSQQSGADGAKLLPRDVDWAKAADQLHQELSGLVRERHEGFESALLLEKTRDPPLALALLEEAQAWEGVWMLVAEMACDASTPGRKIQLGHGVVAYQETVSSLLRQLKVDLSTEPLAEQTLDVDKARDDYYRALRRRFDGVADLMPVMKRLERDEELVTLQQERLEKAVAGIQLLFDEASTLLQRPVVKVADLCRVNLLQRHMELFKKHFPDSSVQPHMVKLRILENLARLEEAVATASALPDVAMRIAQMKVIGDNVLGLKDEVARRIDEALDAFRHRGGSIPRLACELSKAGSVGPSVVQEHGCFKGWNIQQFNSKTKHHDLAYVLRNLTAEPPVDAKHLAQLHSTFDLEYAALLQRHVYHGMVIAHELDLLATACQARVAEALQGRKGGTEAAYADSGLMHALAPSLLAHLMAMWTVHNACHFLEAEGDPDRSYLLMPHAAQVVAALCMLGLAVPGEVRGRSLVQVMTGEGKSVVVASTASILALLGADVSCACYSEILSARDRDDFRFLFQAAGVMGRVHYGTFASLAERLINHGGDVRDLTLMMLLRHPKQAIAVPRANTGRGGAQARVLIIDEVDVFFSKELYGSQYTPSCAVGGDCVARLVQYVWDHRARLHSLWQLQDLPEYKECVELLAEGCGHLVDGAVEGMIRDVRSFSSPPYVVKDGRIGYKEHGGVVTNKVVGYKTTFAYLHEAALGTVPAGPAGEPAALAEGAVASLHLPCGSFSFAEMPDVFDTVAGVTGTLRQLSGPESRVVEEVYRIRHRFYLPSVYGVNNCLFHRGEHVQAFPRADGAHAMALTKQLQDKTGIGRPVLVFFEDEGRLREYRTFLETARVPMGASAVQAITEAATAEERMQLTRRATTARTVTLLVPSMGRGIDFQCLDPDVRDKGGLHVVQTFVSANVAEETQIMGRTARQGELGSFAMLLVQEDLQAAFGVTPPEVERSRAEGGLYRLLDDKRVARFEERYRRDTAAVSAFRERHAASMRFVQLLHCGPQNLPEALAALQELYPPAPAVRAATRTLVLMDATASMRSLLAMAKATVGDMMAQAGEVLARSGNEDSPAGRFEMQFAVFRNYSSGRERILEHSTWECDPRRLRCFLEKVRAERGQGNEAIEVGLWHANQEWVEGVDMQVILIGDAAPNTPAEVRSKREGHGTPGYWEATAFGGVVSAQAEAQLLAQRGVPVHAFYLRDLENVQLEFEALAQATGGSSGLLDMRLPDASRILTDTVAQEILRRVGGESLGDAYVQQYRDLFCCVSYSR